ncbi:MAG: release factor glutamine methyltransferase [Gammaproteobacteria bacterium]|nr:MAG: release factor glutamine methyltransferase [Gammaproteobacteria bacterium]
MPPSSRPPASAVRLDRLLAWARARLGDREDAVAVLGAALGLSRTQCLARPETPLAGAALRRAVAAVRACRRGLPLAYWLGEWAFHELTLAVNPATLVPRPDTERLVERALVLGDALGRRPRVVDLGTGSGCIALALARQRPRWRITAVDSSTAALAVARVNAARLGLGGIRWRLSDWWAALPGECFELILSNPPYVATADPHFPDLVHEPRRALHGGPDGLRAVERLLADSAAHLAPGGVLLIEIGYNQAPRALALARRHGWVGLRVHPDLAGRPRLLEAHRRALPPRR